MGLRSSFRRFSSWYCESLAEHSWSKHSNISAWHKTGRILDRLAPESKYPV
ncbi:hypothetical protein OESDEN_01239 [Oesophagostomum dentatum]|uniref:Uncharacterized protein n=1 Tax=Oesophagostomum dentatum TaxID=61180 RepID=A0A0B1TNE5_OESDE|nr:hypothetical protein OESDEN_01239 [Oesophagostomum dentatum]